VKWLLKNGADVHLQNIVREVEIEVIIVEVVGGVVVIVQYEVGGCC
jgi:hypothetical protein